MCGVSIEFRLRIDESLKVVEKAGFSTNGCGYAVAVAELLSRGINGKKLVELDGLSVLEGLVTEALGDAPKGRNHCFNVSFDALQLALSDFRRKRIAEWNGEDALICSCFGVSEKQIEKAISGKKQLTVANVGEICNAGTGCGSCQPLIQEILDGF